MKRSKSVAAALVVAAVAFAAILINRSDVNAAPADGLAAATIDAALASQLQVHAAQQTLVAAFRSHR